jgi:predicted nucleic acid-binding protein
MQKTPITIDTDTPFRAFDLILGLARTSKLTGYDAAYLDLVMRLGLPLATLDGDLEKAATANGVPIYTPQRGTL